VNLNVRAAFFVNNNRDQFRPTLIADTQHTRKHYEKNQRCRAVDIIRWSNVLTLETYSYAVVVLNREMVGFGLLGIEIERFIEFSEVSSSVLLGRIECMKCGLLV